MMPEIVVSASLDVAVDGVQRGRLAAQEAALLAALAAGRGRVVGYGRLYDVLRVRADTTEERKYVSVIVCHVRRAIGADAILTVWGLGYCLAPGWTVDMAPEACLVIRVPDDLVPPLTRAAEREGIGLEETVAIAIDEFCGGDDG